MKYSFSLSKLFYEKERLAHGVVVGMAVMNYMIVSRRLREGLFEVNGLRAVAGRISGHNLVEGAM